MAERPGGRATGASGRCSCPIPMSSSGSASTRSGAMRPTRTASTSSTTGACTAPTTQRRRGSRTKGAAVDLQYAAPCPPPSRRHGVSHSPAERRVPVHARGPLPRLPHPGCRRELGGTLGRAAAVGRVPDGAPRCFHHRRWRPGGTLVRNAIGRGLRLVRRRRPLGAHRQPPASRALRPLSFLFPSFGQKDRTAALLAQSRPPGRPGGGPAA